MSHPHLPTILDVYPQCSTHCYGYAPSKGRRCKLPTKQDDRNKASRLLNYGTHLLQRGLSVDSLLVELAPLLLCWRHKDEANSLVRVWRTRLQALQEQWLLAAVLKSLSEYADSRARELAAASTGEQRVEGRVLRPTQPAVVETAEEEEDEEEEERGGGGGGREEPELEHEPETSSVRTSTETSAPAVPSATVEPTVSQSETRTVTRKPIEGDCEICMCPLRGEDGDQGSDQDSDDEDEDDVSDAASDDEEDGHEEDDDDLVYCKNQCGRNYHKICIDEWLATQSTFRDPRGNPVWPSCPTCRAVWSS